MALQNVLQRLNAKARVVLGFLDACRNNPLKQSKESSALIVGQKDGLAREDLTAKNTFLAFATEPGNVAYDGTGRNSPFTTALLAHLDRPGIELSVLMTDVRRQVFETTKQKQLPWTNSSLLDRLFLKGQAVAGKAPAAPGRILESDDPAAVLAAANELFASKSLAEAAQMYERAAELKAVPAMTAFGNMLTEGIGVPKDPARAHEWYLRAADSDDAEAQFLIGRNYETGKGGVVKDLKQALGWYRKAANGGNGDAMNNMAVMHALGEGVKADFGEAVRWYQKAAEAGNGNAMFNLAALYDEGQGVKKSPKTAARWVMRSILAKIEGAKLEMANNSAAWSPAFRKMFQREMKGIGVYKGAIDGDFGPGTVAAIERINQ